MIRKLLFKSLALLLFITFNHSSFAQDQNSNKSSEFNNISRQNNILSLQVGTMLLNNDFKTPDFENFIELQYKRFIVSSINISSNIKKFDIKDYAFQDKGFLSGNLNLEWYVLPQNRVTPYLYLGAGILTSNDFKDQNYKAQGGLGIEYLITNQLALNISLETNYVYDEQKGSVLMLEVNQTYYNTSFGLNFYFGNKPSKTSKSKRNKTNQPTVIESNLIE